MSFSDEETIVRRYQKPVVRNYSEVEMLELDKELEEFRVTKEVEFPKKMTISFINEDSWLRSKKALGEEGGVVIDNLIIKHIKRGGVTHSDIDCDPVRFEDLSLKLQAWNWWKSKKEFGNKKRIEGLEELAKDVTVIDIEDVF